MQFGRLASLDGVSFAVPPLPARSERVLAASSSSVPPRGVPDGPWLRIGAPAWSRRDWLGKLYPAGSTARDWLRLYASQAGAIELNATFHAIPDEATLDGWVEATPPGFRFCPKVPKTISHALGDAQVPRAIAHFVERMRRFGERLGPALLQLADTFPPSGLGLLDAALRGFPEGFPLAVEVRHAGWFGAGREEGRGRFSVSRFPKGYLLSSFRSRLALPSLPSGGVAPTSLPPHPSTQKLLSLGLSRAVL